MPHPEHHVRQILATLHSDPGSTALISRGEPVHAGVLASAVETAAPVMHRHGIGPGSLVAVLTDPNTAADLRLRWAANLLGATVVHIRGVNAVNPDEELPLTVQREILTSTRPAMLAVDTANVERARQLCEPLAEAPLVAVLWAAGDTVDLTAADALDPAAVREGDIAVVTFTSGSTGRAEGRELEFPGQERDGAGTGGARSEGHPADHRTADALRRIVGRRHRRHRRPRRAASWLRRGGGTDSHR
ncbi:AMP-binding enzyme [Micromonospora nigra]|uniref:AMP-binding enzyme n=1 Tax=Micromonospora nigra TaxID=145857 RepID=A0A1C6SS26_9ACTN|nr:AMP-binding protein [Micromonospora nigra]SCL32260.1 AMP-binding enzyme [Micromonospora nigra]